jgi:fructose-bisphosphate aldolase class 1
MSEYIRRVRRMSENLESVAATLVADGKGILAADESVATLTMRFDPLGSSQPKPDPMVTS